MKYGWPTSIVGRTVIVLLLGLMISNLVGFAFYWTERSHTLSSSLATQVAERITSLAQIVEEIPAEERRPFVRDIRRGPGLRITWTRNAPVAIGKTTDLWALGVRDAVVEELGKGGEERVRVSVADPASPPEIDDGGDDRPDRGVRGGRERFGRGFGAS